MLHITNGSSVSLSVPGEIVYWVDVLHEGPVPAGLKLEELSHVREQFLSGYLNEPVSFADRDAALNRFRDHEEVVLWFEHDLYDQLHLLQLLDWFSHQNLGSTRLSLISVNYYLGHLEPSQLTELFPTRHQVTSAEYQVAQLAWRAFTAPDPTGISALLAGDAAALPFLRDALGRHLEQFPALHNGLSRTEGQALQLVAQGPRKFAELFLEDQKLEPSIFMGDSIYRRYLLDLQQASNPLLQEAESGFELTQFGRKVLPGQADHVEINGINRWRGGVHLCEGAPVWRWDANHGTIAP